MSKNKLIIISGLLIIITFVFYFYNYVYLKGLNETRAYSSNQIVMPKAETSKLDASFFSNSKLIELREIHLDLVPVNRLKTGNANLFR